MKAPRITIRKLRKLCPALPSDAGEETFLLLRTDASGRVKDAKLFANHPELTRTAVHGFTHWARLPAWIQQNVRNEPRDE